MRDAGGKKRWPLPNSVIGYATFSDDGQHRYLLGRSWSTSPAPTAMFVGLNPSTASPEVDDPTVRKCWKWAQAWGFGSMWMLNAYAYIATDPVELEKAADPVGPANDEYLVRHARSAELVVAAWGRGASRRGLTVRRLLAGVTILHCLGTTDDGSPSHPLYLANETRPFLWT